MPNTKSILSTIDQLIADAERGAKIPTEVIDLLGDIAIELGKSKDKKESKEKKAESEALLGKFDKLLEATASNKQEFEEFKESMLEAIKAIQIKNDVNVTVPDVIVPEITVPEVKVHIPPIEVPEVKVNIPKIVVPEQPAPIVNIPETMSLKKPVWLSIITEPISRGFKDIKTAISEIKWPTDPKKPIAVRLSDGKEFYKAIMGGVSSFVGEVMTFATSSGEKKAALVDEDGRLQIDISSFPGFNIPTYDHISLTYVSGGNGDGEIQTVTYYSGGASGTVVAILTLTYNSDNEIATVSCSIPE